MKTRRFLLTLFLLASVFSLTAHADSVTERQASALETEKIEDSLAGDAAEIMDGESIREGVDGEKLLGRLISFAGDKFAGILRKSAVSASMLVLTALLCSVASSFIGTNGLGDVDTVTLAGVMAVSALSFGGVRSFVGEASKAAGEIDAFAKMLLPALTAAGSASGNISASATKYAVITLFMSIMITVIQSVILPLVYAYIASSIAANAFGGDALSGAASLMKWAATNILIVLVLTFTVTITVSGVVSGTADASATRLTKTVISTALPVVGGILSDAAQTVLTGAASLKNTIGIYGLFAVLAICLTPFLRLGVSYVLYKGAAILASAVAGKAIGKTIGSLSSAVGILLGATGACALMLFFGIVSVIKAVAL